jgi:nucleoside-diphosphate-sugar epimerase
MTKRKTLLITGAAGNLGMFLTNSLLLGPYKLRLMIHHKSLPEEIVQTRGVSVHPVDLGDPSSLLGLCEGVDCIVHFAGVLFKPFPQRFLQNTNLGYVQNLASEASQAGVKRIILISFPHVEGESTPDKPAGGVLSGTPGSIHAQTRLAAEKHLLRVGEEAGMQIVALRAGMIYGGGILMLEAARWLLKRRLLPIWRRPTWIHLISLPDFLGCVHASIARDSIHGIINLGDESPLTLQDFLLRLSQHWGYPAPRYAPRWSFYWAAWTVELFAGLFNTSAPITRDFIRIGMASYCADTSRMKQELRPVLSYPTFDSGVQLL